MPTPTGGPDEPDFANLAAWLASTEAALEARDAFQRMAETVAAVCRTLTPDILWMFAFVIGCRSCGGPRRKTTRSPYCRACR